MVRLKEQCGFLWGCKVVISIPVWCDWKVVKEVVKEELPEISIPVWCDWKLERTRISPIRWLFQFQYGAIESYTSIYQLTTHFIISIPVWCDWKCQNVVTRTIVSHISIPVWCDWKTKNFSESGTSFKHFNSSMVRLKVSTDVSQQKSRANFNSSMVRLKVYLCWYCCCSD